MTAPDAYNSLIELWAFLIWLVLYLKDTLKTATIYFEFQVEAFKHMAKKTLKRKIIGLVCENCKQRHHYTVKNTQNTPEKISLHKYCPTTRSYATHTETTKNLGRNVVKAKK